MAVNPAQISWVLGSRPDALAEDTALDEALMASGGCTGGASGTRTAHQAPKALDEKKRLCPEEWHAGDLASAIAATLDVSRATIYRVIVGQGYALRALRESVVAVGDVVWQTRAKKRLAIFPASLLWAIRSTSNGTKSRTGLRWKSICA
ncbi:MAG TPA: hypothetical protein VGH69_06245 [Mycobacterium sp.]